MEVTGLMDDATALLISALAAILPTLVYVTILWWLDHFEKEPRRLLLTAFFWGALPAAILSLIAERGLVPPLSSLGASAAELMSSSVLAPVVEELAKGLAVLLLFIFAHSEFDDTLDGIIYAATVGFGFAMTENFLYFMRSSSTGGLETLTFTILMRAFIFGMNHALFTSVFGATLGYVQTLKRGLRRFTLPAWGLLGGMLLHGIHNLFASLASKMCFSVVVSIISDWAGVLVIFVVMALALRQEQHWIVVRLRPEVDSGLLTEEEYHVLGSYNRRMAAWWRARLHSGQEARRFTRFTQLATELAFKLEQGDQARADKLRVEIAKLRGAVLDQGGRTC
jgi:RsiW-degrading membrane proteinase PrsW (M82 family)